MLLCKEIGIDLNSWIVLADEAFLTKFRPRMMEAKNLDEILIDSRRLKALSSPAIYEQKAGWRGRT